MPNCKNCGARISKFDADMCPVCGVKKPLEGVTSETVEITTELNVEDPAFKDYKGTKRITACLLSAFLGVFGVGFFYTKRSKTGLIWLLINLVLIGGVGSLLAFVVKMDIVWSFIIPLVALYLVNIAIGLYFLLKPDLKDGNGEFMH